MRTGEPSPRSDVTSTKSPGRGSFSVFLAGTSAPAQTLSHTSPPGTASSTRDRAHSDVPVSARIEMIRAVRPTRCSHRRNLTGGPQQNVVERQRVCTEILRTLKRAAFALNSSHTIKPRSQP
jgi:hypothetical protein